MSSGAVLFDIDGTLVDSNYQHVNAWGAAFAAVGRPASAWRIHRAIGMDSAKLLQDILGNEADRLGDDAKQIHKDEYAALESRLRVFDRARELLAAVRERDLQVVLATSAPQDELARLRTLLDCEELISKVTSSEDVEAAKPAPDVVESALDKAGVTADRAVLVGDAADLLDHLDQSPIGGLLAGGP